MNLIGSGREADIYEHGGQALKTFRDWVPVEHIEYEADVSKKAAEVCDSAPRFYGMEQLDGKTVLKFEIIQGKMLSTVFRNNLFRLIKNTHGFAKLHREINGNTVSGLRTTVEKFEGSLLRYTDISADNMDKLLNFLRQSKEKALCHGDLHPENVIVDENGRMRVIDWASAYCGDPLSDVARTYYLLKHGTPPGERTGFTRTMEKQAGELIGREYLKSYFDGRKIPIHDLDMWGLIIRIHRYGEGIEEEKEDLKKAIAFGIHHLLEA